MYTTADGLPSNNIAKIVLDSHGFLWFCSDEGLSRFDGYSFVNYRAEQGLPSSDVRDLLETRSGQYWVATSRGVCRFHPNLPRPDGKRPRFEVYRLGEDADSNSVQTLFENRAGTIWAGTWNGLYRLAAGTVRFSPHDLGLRADYYGSTLVKAFLEDRRGDLWVGTGSKLCRLRREANIEQYSTGEGLPPWRPGSQTWINSLMEDRQGRIWVGTRGGGLCRLVPEPGPNGTVVEQCYSERQGLLCNRTDFPDFKDCRVRTVVEARDGRLWLATSTGLAEQRSAPGAEPKRFQTYTTAEGLSEGSLNTVAEDREGNLWVGAANVGAMKVARNGFTTYDAADGLALETATAVIESRAGELLVATTNGAKSLLALNRFDGDRFHATWPNFGAAVHGVAWWYTQTLLQDRMGDWWFSTPNGLCHFPSARAAQLARVGPEAIYGASDGFTNGEFRHVFEDSRGDIWIATAPTRPGSATGLTRWSRATGSFHHYSFSESPDLAATSAFARDPSAFAEDRLGGVWIGFSGGVLMRFQEGRFTRITCNGSPKGPVGALYADRVSRMWFSDDSGLTRIDQPGAEHPVFVHYGTAQGLSGDSVHCITEDRWHRIYVGTARGVDCLDLSAASIKHYTTADGLVRGQVEIAYCDRQGRLWFGTSYGISQLTPEPDSPPAPAQLKIIGLRIRGLTQSISDLGETTISGLTLPSQNNQVQIDFTGLGFSSGDLHYQYMLEGADRTWNPPTDQRTVNYASLSPGTYRFLVRAVTGRGAPNSPPAVVAFRILPPLWLRWWFLMLAALAMAAAFYALHRYRLAKSLEVERIRTRIATDLHDDIGASLSQVALLSEVVGQKIDGDASVRAPLEQIGGTSRQLVEAMSDIVWSINPKRDTLADLTQRMRAFASDVLPARQVAFEFRAPQDGQDLKLGIEARRQVYLIFKESVNNIVRHAQASAAEIDFRIERDWLVLRISDNGKGFEPQPGSTGHGLASMKERAAKLGGEFEVSSGERGTTVTLRVPT